MQTHTLADLEREYLDRLKRGLEPTPKFPHTDIRSDLLGTARHPSSRAGTGVSVRGFGPGFLPALRLDSASCWVARDLS